MEAKMLKDKVAIITGASYGMGQTMGRAVWGQVLQVCNGAFL